MAEINNVCDYIIFRVTTEGGQSLSNLKLQKLLYYSQAWNLAFNDGKPLFDGKFQAWVHGPVNRAIFDRFKQTKILYSEITPVDILNTNFFNDITEEEKRDINSILEVYSPYSDVQLELMTHREDPWIEARKGLKPTEKCENEINEKLMEAFYKARL